VILELAEDAQRPVLSLQALGVAIHAVVDVADVRLDLGGESPQAAALEDLLGLPSGGQRLVVASQVHERVDHGAQDTRALDLVPELAVEPLGGFVVRDRLAARADGESRQALGAMAQGHALRVGALLGQAENAVGQRVGGLGVGAVERFDALLEPAHEGRRGGLGARLEHRRQVGPAPDGVGIDPGVAR
jgi:hypothetical protein